jgi:hypothetical protein
VDCVCSRSSCLSFFFCLTLEGGGGICVLSCVLYFSHVGRDLFAVSFVGDMNVCTLVLARSLF